jgi:hypothetical protein
MALVALMLPALSVTPAGATTDSRRGETPPAAPAAGGAAASVGNGLSTTDLNAVGMSPAALAAALVGPGVSVSNVTFSGANAQAGTIHLVDPAVVSFNVGVIMSSGNIADVVGPNKSDGITGDMAGPADADLNALIQNTQTVNPVTFDAASLEFDFVPSASTVYFTYTFASDEYLEWVNLFNDVFAFYVNGQNCATVPSGDPVSIDTINNAVNPNLFRDNSFSSPPPNPINIESDGLSVEMICSATVNAGQVNHMKLAIADTSDQILDSVVMLKSGSLSVTPPESCNDSVDNDDDGFIDDADSKCQATTTPPPPGTPGIGSSNNPPAFTGNEGSPITLDGSALADTPSADTIETSWTVTGINGTPGTCEVTPADRLPIEPDRSIAPVTAICPNEGEYVARVDGWDVEGGASWDTDVDFFVHNAPPTVAIDTPTSGTEVVVGSPVDLSAFVADPGVSDLVTCEIDWGDGVTEPGTLVGGACTGTHTYTETGGMALAVTATDDAGDSSADAVVLDVVTPPSLVLKPGAGGVMEGDSGQVTVNVPITLSAPSPDPVTVDYTTLDPGGVGVAAAGADFLAKTGTLTFAPGETSKSVSITVLGDRIDEPPLYIGEWIFVAFSNASGATIDPAFYSMGLGVIGDDDPPPTIKPGAGGVREGNTGDAIVQVPVVLSNPSATTITVHYATLDVAGSGMASTGTDFAPKSGTVTFAPGETAKTVAITVHGDTTKEPPLLWGEWIWVAFSNPSANASLDMSFYGLGLGIIIDDD